MSETSDDPDLRLQIYRMGGKLVIRSPPTGPPSEAQRICRERFAQAAKRARGAERTGFLPPAAEEVRAELKDFRTDAALRRPARRSWRDIVMELRVYER